MSSPTTDHSPDDLRVWLTQRVAHYVERPYDSIEASASLLDYGLDSVFAVSLCGDLEDHLRISLDHTVVWDHPSIEALIAYLRTLEVLVRTAP